MIFDIQVDPYWPKWQSKHSKLGHKDFETCKFHQDMWNRYLMLGFVVAHIPSEAISNLELWRSYKALRNDLVLPSTTILSNFCRRDYPLSMDVVKKQLLSRNEVSSTLDGWTSPNTLAIRSVNAYSVDWNWALREVQLAFNEVNCLFCSRFES